MATRRHKAELEGRRFDDGWKDEADLAGWGPFDAEAATVAHTAPDFAEVWRLPTVGFDDDGRVDHYDRVVDPDEYVATVLRHDLTADRTTFTTPDLYRVIAARQGQGVTIDTIERVAARFVASDQVIAVASSDGQRRWTSREILDTEQHLIAHLQRNHTHRPLPPNSIATAAAHRTLGGDQHSAVEIICSSTASVMVLVGPAGTGKTYTVDAIRTAFEHNGHTVVGAAPSARRRDRTRDRSRHHLQHFAQPPASLEHRIRHTRRSLVARRRPMPTRRPTHPRNSDHPPTRSGGSGAARR